jgi:hypothetical protein
MYVVHGQIFYGRLIRGTRVPAILLAGDMVGRSMGGTFKIFQMIYNYFLKIMA